MRNIKVISFRERLLLSIRFLNADLKIMVRKINTTSKIIMSLLSARKSLTRHRIYCTVEEKIAVSLNKAVNGKNTVGNSLLAVSWNVYSVVTISHGGAGIVVLHMKKQFGSVPLTRRREKDFVRTAKE